MLEVACHRMGYAMGTPTDLLTIKNMKKIMQERRQRQLLDKDCLFNKTLVNLGLLVNQDCLITKTLVIQSLAT
jgi:hypothetical protein